MSEPAEERRLAAILFTDIVGYTALMAESESAAQGARDRHREIVRETVPRYGGRCIEAPGDESLSIFASALEAVNSALAIVQATSTSGPRLHVGIHLGDVVLREGEVSGDGVNIAARICALSDGEGVFVSDEVRQAVRNQPHLSARSIGTRELKNVRRPVEVHVLDGRAPPPRARRRSPVRRRWIVAAAALLAVGVLWWGRSAILGQVLDGLGLGLSSAAPTLPEEPSLAVLPFASRGDTTRAFLADGITDDLTTEFLGVPGILVVSRNSAFAYRGDEVDLERVSGELGVRYVVRGSVHAEENRVRVTVELTDATTGFQLWSQRYDRVLANVLELQDEIAEEILSTLSVRLREAELNRIRRKPTDDLSAYEAMKRGQSEFYHFTRESNERARALFEQATEIDPEYAEAHAFLANTYNYEYTGGWNQDPSLLDRAEALVHRALELDPLSPVGHASQTAAHIARRRWPDAVDSGERAVELAPSYEFAHFLLGMAYRGDGRFLAALESIQRGMRLDPRGQAPVLAFLAELNYRAGRVEEAVAEWERLRRANPDHVATRLALARHYDRSGRKEEADVALREVLRINPDYRVDLARGAGGRELPAEEARWLERRLATVRATAPG